jgi:hypothetical protein
MSDLLYAILGAILFALTAGAVFLARRQADLAMTRVLQRTRGSDAVTPSGRT